MAKKFDLKATALGRVTESRAFILARTHKQMLLSEGCDIMSHSVFL